MSLRFANATSVVIIVVCVCSCTLVSLAGDPPDAEVNPTSGYIETVDATWATDHYDVRHVIDPGGGLGRDVFAVSTDPHDDLAPRLAISSAGETWVTWFREDTTQRVLVRKRNFVGGTWGDERLVSDKDENSRRPEIVHDGTIAWVAFEFDDVGGTGVAVNSIIDEPNPIGARITLRTTSYDGDLAVLIHTESGHLWVTWVDSDTEVGWSEYDYGSEVWGTPGYESYASDGVDEARERIRDGMVGE